MPRFHYQAIDQNGRLHRDMKEAKDVEELAGVIWQEQQLYLLSCRASRLLFRLKINPFKRVSEHDLIMLCFHLAHLEQGGVSLLEGITLFSEQTTSPLLQQALRDIQQSVYKGWSLSHAFGQHSALFNDFFVAILQMSERTGKLSQGLMLLQDYLQAAQDLRWQIKSSLRYPLLMGAVIGSVIGGLLFFLVPQVEGFLRATVEELPLSTRILLWFSSHAGIVGVSSAGGVIVLSLILYALKTSSLRCACALDRCLLKLPLLGPIRQKILWVHLFQALTIALEAGLALDTALKVSAGLLRNQWFQAGLERLLNRIAEGASLPQSFGDAGIFSPLILSMLRAAEQTNKLPATFKTLARYHKHQIDHQLQRLVVLIQPAFLMVFGGILLWIVVCLFYPLYESILYVE